MKILLIALFTIMLMDYSSLLGKNRSSSSRKSSYSSKRTSSPSRSFGRKTRSAKRYRQKSSFKSFNSGSNKKRNSFKKRQQNPNRKSLNKKNFNRKKDLSNKNRALQKKNKEIKKLKSQVRNQRNQKNRYRNRLEAERAYRSSWRSSWDVQPSIWPTYVPRRYGGHNVVFYGGRYGYYNPLGVFVALGAAHYTMNNMASAGYGYEAPVRTRVVERRPVVVHETESGGQARLVWAYIMGAILLILVIGIMVAILRRN